MKHVMELRQLLEGAALERLRTVPDGDRWERLSMAVARQREAFDQNDFQRYQEWHFRFHFDIVDTLDNPLISMLYKQVMALMREPMERAGAVPRISAQAIRDHEQILAAVKHGSIEDVRHVLRDHLVDFYTAMQGQGAGDDGQE